jgi:hypothetical protein
MQSDIYALGVTIFNLITNGTFPYLLPQYLIDNDSFNKFKVSKINENIKKIIFKCINLNINERYKNYDEILNDLNIKENDIYVPSIGDIIDYIQTLRRTGQRHHAKKYIMDTLNEYQNHPYLLNQLAIIEKEENGISAGIKLYENFLSKQFSYDKLLYIECIFNLIGFYFESKRFKEIVPFFNAYNEYFNDSIYIMNEFIEYSIFLGFNKEYQKSYMGLYKYCSKHSYNDLHVLFILAISLKVNKTKECMELIRIKKSETVLNILNLYNELNSGSFKMAIKDMEIEIFGGI